MSKKDKVYADEGISAKTGNKRPAFDELLQYVSSIDGKHITPIIFTRAQPFFESKAAVEYNGKMGYVDRNKVITNPNNKWEYAIEPKFDMAGDFDNGRAEVSIDGLFYTINENGQDIYSVDNAPALKKEKK